MNYIKEIFLGIYHLLQGMYVSMLNMLRPKVTEQYPENRKTKVKLERFRALLVMPHTENNHHRCTACGVCMHNCPNDTIRIVSKTITDETTGKDKKILDAHLYDLGSCIFCGLCTQTCPHDAIVWSNEFEHSLFTRSKLVKKLNREGSSLMPKNKEE